MMGRRSAASWIAGCAVACLLAAGSAQLAAAAVGLEVSRDGIHWSRNFAEPLFDPDLIWVPGDQVTSVFYARNDSGTNTNLVLIVEVVGGDLRFGSDLAVSARVDGVPTPVRAGRMVAAVAPGGQPRRIELTVRMPASDQNSTQLESLTFNVRVQATTVVGPATEQPSVPARPPIVDAAGAAGSGNRQPGPEGGPSWLAGTGAPIGLLAVALLGVALVAAGVRFRRPTPEPAGPDRSAEDTDAAVRK